MENVLINLVDEWGDKLVDLEQRYFKNPERKNLSQNVLKRHIKDKLMNVVLMLCYHNVFKKYGSLIPTIYESEQTFTNSMGIMFTEDIEDDYLNEVESLFLDGSYEYKFYDYLRYVNIGEIDIKKIKSEYPNLNSSTIRDVTIYSKNSSIREQLFKYLSNKSDEFQSKVCSVICPITIELTTDKKLNCCNEKKFTDMVMNLIKGKENKIEDIDYLYNEISNLHNKYNIKNSNLIYMCEFEYLFQDLLISMIEKIDEGNIDILLRTKKFSLENIPKITGEIKRIPKYKEVSYEVIDCGPDDRENALYPFHTESNLVEDGEHIINNIDYSEKEVLNEKKAIIKVIEMFLIGNIDYKELFEFDCSIYINNLIEFINNKEKVKKYAIKRTDN